MLTIIELRWLESIVMHYRRSNFDVFVFINVAFGRGNVIALGCGKMLKLVPYIRDLEVVN